MGHPGLLSAQPDRRATLLRGEGRQWYHLRAQKQNSETRGEGAPPASSVPAFPIYEPYEYERAEPDQS